MAHETEVVMSKQVSDELFAICVGCCGLHGQITACSKADDATQCPQCADHEMAHACTDCGLITHPGCRLCKAAGHTHETDTRSWHTMHSTVVNNVDQLAASIDWKHTTVATNHEAALQAATRITALVGSSKKHEGN